MIMAIGMATERNYFENDRFMKLWNVVNQFKISYSSFELDAVVVLGYLSLNEGQCYQNYWIDVRHKIYKMKIKGVYMPQ